MDDTPAQPQTPGDTPSGDATPRPKLTEEERQQRKRARKKRQRKLAKEAAARQRVTSPPVVVRPMATKARPKRRHWGLIFAFLVMVVGPTAGAAWYFYERAVDQYSSTVGFTVRSEDINSAADILGGLGSTLGAGGSASRDGDILYEFILSQEIVAKIDARIDLRGLYATHYDRDPLMSYNPDGTIEDLTDYWQRMVRVSYDSGGGLMELRVLAFTPEDARRIAELIFEESSTRINALSAIARADATRYAQDDLDLALERLKIAREALTAFRLANQIVDPNADIQTQVGLLATLQEQQATALIEYQLISETARAGDPRVEQARRRLEVIEAQIAEERKKFGVGGGGAGGVEYATTISEFERLTVDREFAETAYAAALSAFDAARAEADRQSRYLAAYINPTLAEKSEFPERPLIILVVGLFSFLVWAVLSLVYYALRDRR